MHRTESGQPGPILDEDAPLTAIDIAHKVATDGLWYYGPDEAVLVCRALTNHVTLDLTAEELLALQYVVAGTEYSGEPTKDIYDERGFDEAYNERDPGYMQALARARRKVTALRMPVTR